MRTAFAVCWVALCVPCSGADDPSKPAKPLADLPKHVEASPGRLTLFADFAHRGDDGQVPVFLVNRTGKPLELRTQDGDFYLKLEYKTADNTWARAQTHMYSFCGNSYLSVTVPDGSFVAAMGYSPEGGGRQAVVRYRVYGQKGVAVASNAGDGIVDPETVKFAAADTFAVREGDFAFVRKVALGEHKFDQPAGKKADLRELALHRLAYGDFAREDAELVLSAVATGNDPKYSPIAGAVLKEYRTRPAGR